MTIAAQRMTDSILIACEAFTNAETKAGNLDTLGADYATIRIAMGVVSNTSTGVGSTLSLLESDDTHTSNFATIVADATSTNITAGKAVTYHVDMRGGRKRYLRLLITSAADTNSNHTSGAIATLSRKEESPSSTGEMADVATIVPA